MTAIIGITFLVIGSIAVTGLPVEVAAATSGAWDIGVHTVVKMCGASWR